MKPRTLESKEWLWVAVGHETLNTRIKSVAVGGCGWLWFLNGDLGG